MIRKIMFLAVLALGLWSCEQEEKIPQYEPSDFDGQWILTDINCFCPFALNPEIDPQFEQHYIWIDTSNSLMLANGKGTYVFQEQGKIYSYEFNDNILRVEGDSRTYTVELQEDQLTFNYIDNPLMSDDEISFTFLRGSAEASCIDFSMVGEGYCSSEYEPVCGCDGITYDNSQEAEYAGVQSWELGECGTD